MVSSIKRKISQVFSKPTGLVQLALDRVHTWAAIGQVLSVCSGMGRIGFTINAPLKREELVAVLKAINELSFAPPERPDWAWHESAINGSIEFFWRSTSRSGRQISVNVDYSTGLASFKWDTGTGTISAFIHDRVFGLVRDEEVVS